MYCLLLSVYKEGHEFYLCSLCQLPKLSYLGKFLLKHAIIECSRNISWWFLVDLFLSTLRLSRYYSLNTRMLHRVIVGWTLSVPTNLTDPNGFVFRYSPFLPMAMHVLEYIVWFPSFPSSRSN
jgi:hypothetical protein